MKTSNCLNSSLVQIAILLTVNLNTFAQIQLGLDIDGEAAGDNSGNSVSMPDINTVAIGAFGNDGNGNGSGHVRVYIWNGSAWVQKGADINGQAADNLCGKSVSMPDANTVAIGSHNNNGNGFHSGHARVFTWNGSAWIQKGGDIEGEAAGDESGTCVSMPDANTVAIGAPMNAGNGTQAGHARIYAWNGVTWLQKGTDIDGEAPGDLSGISVDMPDANTVAIGAHSNDGNGSLAGHVRIFSWNGSSWIQKGTDIDGEAAGDYSGTSVSMPNSNMVAIGAPINAGNGSQAGQVRIFSWNGGSWIQQGIDIDGEAAGDRSGISVSMADSVSLAIGAFHNNGNGAQSGQVRIYSWNGSAWMQIGADIDGEAANDLSGFSVSMPSANVVAIGAIGNDGSGADAGHVRVYSQFSVSIHENDFENKMVVYPSPASGDLTLDLGSTYTRIDIIVRNIIGKEIKRNSFTRAGKLQLSLPGEAGIYLIEINADNRKARLKAVKE